MSNYFVNIQRSILTTPNITITPLPGIIDLAIGIIGRNPSNKDLSYPWLARKSDSPYWFSKSAFSLAFIYSWWKLVINKKSPAIWIPNYFCNYALRELRIRNANIVFYPINESLEPDWEICNDLANKEKPDIFILVHYYGYPSDVQTAKRFCSNKQCLFIEDATHSLRPEGDIGKYGDFVLYSPHKFFAIPDGAILIINNSSKIFSKFNRNKVIEQFKKLYAILPNKSQPTIIWMIKRLIQKIVPTSIITILGANKKKKIAYTETDICPQQSSISRRILFRQIKSIDQISLKRKINHSILSNCFYSNSKQSIPNYESTPYQFRLSLKNETDILLFNRIKKMNWPFVMQWPDLPSEITSTNEINSVALQYAENSLFIPIHQGISICSIKNLINCLCHINTPLTDKDYTIKWVDGNNKEWDSTFKSTIRPSIIQSNSYSKTKAEIDNYQLKHGFIKKNNKTVAICNVLVKKIGPVSLFRINRGPVFFNDHYWHKYFSIRIIKNQWKWYRGEFVVISPNFILTPENLGIMLMSGYNEFKIRRSWTSSVVNLTQRPNELRMGLSGKWRNQLVRSEKNDLRLVNSSSRKSLSFLLDKYEEMKVAKRFKGPAKEFYNHLFNLDNDVITILFAESAGLFIAGILLLTHGTGCTYQVGWVSDKGRILYANNFLLWNALLVMKEKGCTFFDLGGINIEDNPGITKFKRGLGGEEYQLVGEWIG